MFYSILNTYCDDILAASLAAVAAASIISTNLRTIFDFDSVADKIIINIMTLIRSIVPFHLAAAHGAVFLLRCRNEIWSNWPKSERIQRLEKWPDTVATEFTNDKKKEKKKTEKQFKREETQKTKGKAQKERKKHSIIYGNVHAAQARKNWKNWRRKNRHKNAHLIRI